MRFLRISLFYFIFFLPFVTSFSNQRSTAGHGTKAVHSLLPCLKRYPRSSWAHVHSQSSRCHRRLITTTISSAADGTNNGSEAEASPMNTSSEPISFNKKGLVKLFNSASVILGALGAILLVLRDETVNTMVASRFGGAAGYGLASGLAYILAGATQHDRLKSDTYKRLNVGLLGFSAMSLVAVPGEAGFFPNLLSTSIFAASATVGRVLSAYAAYTGWVKGLGGNASVGSLSQSFFNGTVESVRGLRAKKNGTYYRNMLVLVALSGVTSFMDGLFFIRSAKELKLRAFEISLQWSAVARLFMISTMIFSLKDAAERNRLTGTTFIQLNVLVGIWAILVGMGQASHPLGHDLSRGLLMFIFGGSFVVSALASTYHKYNVKPTKE